MSARQRRIAMVDLTMTPYRLHFQQRVVRELPGVHLLSARLHDRDFLPWTLQLPAELEAVSFAAAGARGVLADVAKGRAISRWLDERAVDAVVLGGYSDLARLEVLAACAIRRRPCFLFGDSNVRADGARGPRGWLKRAALPRLLHRCAGVLVCGTLGRDYYRRYGVDDRRVFLVPYEPDYGAFEGAPRAARPERRRLLFSGRLVPEKRVDLLLAAFSELAEERPEWDLVIVGEGPLASALAGNVEPALAHRVRFEGFVDGVAELAAVYRSSDVLVVPSDFEPWGVVVNEGVAAGLALVCSDVVGAAADLVRDGVNGRVFRAGSVSSLVAALRDVTMPSQLGRMQGAAAEVLRDWRHRADPVAGLRAALASVGLA